MSDSDESEQKGVTVGTKEDIEAVVENADAHSGALSPRKLDITEREAAVAIDEGRYVVSTTSSPPDVPPEEIVEDGYPGADGGDTQQGDTRVDTQTDVAGADASDTADNDVSAQETEHDHAQPREGSEYQTRTEAETRGRNQQTNTRQDDSRHDTGDIGDRQSEASSTARRPGVTDVQRAERLLATAAQASDRRYAVFIQAELDGARTRSQLGSDNIVATFDNLVRWYCEYVSPDGTDTNEVLRMLVEESHVLGHD